MKISAKGRYALAAATSMAQYYSGGEYITVLSISERLGVSKIYLEQVFSLLKRGELVTSIKGSQGGYMLSRKPDQITAFDILSAVEGSLFEKTQETVAQKAADIEKAMQISVFDVFDRIVEETLGNITLLDIANEAEKQKGDSAVMFYI